MATSHTRTVPIGQDGPESAGEAPSPHAPGNGMAPQTLAAVGVIFGDIGTSPLYTVREVFASAELELSRQMVFSVLSMIFWSVMIIVSCKYVLLMLRFDHRGEGGVLSLLSLTLERVRRHPALVALVTLLGVFAAALFFGDAMITPAMTVMSAVEGITVVAPGLADWVVPISALILVSLFWVQRKGTAMVGRVFGPVMLLWFVVIALLGIGSIVRHPEVLQAVDPRHALWLFQERSHLALIAMGAVFLCVTGAEAMYADLGHFGRAPIRAGWFTVVLPALFLNYMGQGALLISDPQARGNPFFLLAPDALRVPLVVLATAAAIIASQAVITGAFSVVQQASRLNLLPRMRVLHTSETSSGQIYIPMVNVLLMIAVLTLVLSFRSSSNLAAAYGLAVNGDLLIGSLLLALTIALSSRARLLWLLLPHVLFIALEATFMVANIGKFGEGGWFPLLIASVMMFVMLTYRRGIDSLRRKRDASPMSHVDGLELPLDDVTRVPGAAVFFSSSAGGCPNSFLHNLKHNKVVHEHTYFVFVDFVEQPRVADEQRISMQRGANGIFRLIARFGYREDPDIHLILALARERGIELQEEFVSFFTSKPVVVSVSGRGLLRFQRRFFGWMLQNSPSVASYMRLPPNRVIELGAQVVI